MAANETDLVQKEVRIRARPETVFGFLTDPIRMIEWFGSAATLDPRPGGVYRVEGVKGNVARGQFVEVDPPRRVVFTFGWDGGDTVPPGSTTVEITLRAEADETVLTLIHRDLPLGGIEPHDRGWSHFLDQLVAAASTDAGAG